MPISSLAVTCFSRKVLRGPLPSFTHFLLTTYVLPSATFGAEFIGDGTRSLAQLDFAQRRWGRHLFGWASGTPSGSVLYELAFADSLRVPLPATVFTLSVHTPGTWAHWCLSLLQHHAAGDPGQFGVGPRCSITVTRRWLQRVVCLSQIALGFVRSPLQCPLHSRSCASLHIRPIGLQFQRRFWHGSMVGTHPTWPRPMHLWTGSSALRRCVFACVLHQSSWRLHPLSDLLHCLCRTYVSSGVQQQHSWIFNPHCAHVSSLLVRCVPASIIADGDVLIYDAS